MARSSIGLDIGTRAVRLAEVNGSGDHVTVNRFGRVLLPVGAVDHGDIRDPKAVGDAIATLWKRLGLSGKSVHIGIANRRVVVRVIEMPAMAPEDLAGALRFQAQDHIPIPLDEAFLDHEVLEEVDGPNGRVQRVLVVAAERGTVESLVAAVKAARLEPATLELNAYPLVRSFSNGSSAAQAIVDIGAGVTDVVVHIGGKIRFTRTIGNIGGDDFTAAVATALGLSTDDAERMKREASDALRERSHDNVSVEMPVPVGVPAMAPAMAAPAVMSTPPAMPATPTLAPISSATAMSEPEMVEPEVAPQVPSLFPTPVAPKMHVVADMPSMPSMPETPHMNGASHDEMDNAPVMSVGSPIEAAAEAMDSVLDRLVAEVRGSLDFYSSQPGAAAIDRVVLTGGASQLGGIAERLSAVLGIDVHAGHPFQRVPVGKVKVSQQEVATAEPFMAVALGLAMAGGN